MSTPRASLQPWEREILERGRARGLGGREIQKQIEAERIRRRQASARKFKKQYRPTVAGGRVNPR